MKLQLGSAESKGDPDPKRCGVPGRRMELAGSRRSCVHFAFTLVSSTQCGALPQWLVNNLAPTVTAHPDAAGQAADNTG